QDRRQRTQAVAQPDPMQQLGDLAAIACLAAALYPQRDRNVLERRHVVEQAEILEHDADAPSQPREAILVEGGDVLIKHADQAARRPKRQEHQTQERGLAGAGRAGQELERVRLDAKAEVAQHFGAEPVAQPYIFETDHPNRPANPAFSDYRAGRNPRRLLNECLISLVSDPLTEDRYQFGTGPVESSMQIACPNCATAYEIEATTLGDGRLVRCVHCRETWVAQPADARALALAEADAAGAAAPSMWQEEQPVSAWAGRD